MSWWVLGEFLAEHELVEAIRTLRARGFKRLDAHTPVPVEAAEEALGLPPSRLPWLAFVAGLGGGAGAYLVQWFCNAVSWPLIVGNRATHSPLAFVPITFETAVLVACTGIFFALMVIFGFPRVTHPVFELDAFRSASIDAFWVSVASETPEDRESAKEVLQKLPARTVSIVEDDK